MNDFNSDNEICNSNWILSYGDMMTSMVVFLLVLLSFSQVNSQKIQEARNSVLQSNVKMPLDQVDDKLSHLSLNDSVTFEQNDQGATVSIKDFLLFDSGHAVISEAAKTKLVSVFLTLKDLPEDYSFSIEGYTDDNPIHTSQYQSNWELSADRAFAVLKYMAELGFDQRRLSYHAFGEYHPFSPNRDEQDHPLAENQSQNRRAIIKIFQKGNAQ